MFDVIKDKDLRVNQDQSLEDYLKEFPSRLSIPIRRIVKRIIGNHTILLTNSFPFPTIESKIMINPVL